MLAEIGSIASNGAVKKAAQFSAISVYKKKNDSITKSNSFNSLSH